MNTQFDELTKSLAQSVTRRAVLKKFGVGLAGMALAGLLALPTETSAGTLGPLIELSRPNAVGTCDTGFRLPGTWTLDDTFEPFVVVNPLNRKNIVAAWIQGPLQNIITAVSLDGGTTWQQVPIPLTTCSGGPFLATGDPWLSFAPNGHLYAVSVAGDSLANRTIAVNKSTDGGLHWSAPVVVSDASDTVPDHPSLTADPLDARFVYAIWQRGDNRKNLSSVMFARTTDGGQTWEPARTILQTRPQDFVQFSQVQVLPDGTLVDVYQLYSQQPNKPITQTSIQVLRSGDRGKTWSAPIHAIAMTPLYTPEGFTSVVDPETGQIVRDTGNQFSTINQRNGELYAVWEDGRFSNFQNNDIAFSMSADGGLSWSAPIRVNQTPLNIPPANRQSFMPVMAVAGDGTIGVTYYDFRFNDANPGLPTDYWLVKCNPSSTRPATDPANWGNEVRLTDSSFNMEACGIILEGFYPGDYFGLAAIGTDFLTAFTQVDQDNVTSIFFRRVGK